MKQGRLNITILETGLSSTTNSSGPQPNTTEAGSVKLLFVKIAAKISFSSYSSTSVSALVQQEQISSINYIG